MTAAELLRLPKDGQRHELVRGQLLSMPYRGALFACTAMHLFVLLTGFTEPRKLGFLFPGDVGYQTEWNPDTVLTCPLGFIPATRLKRADLTDRYIQGPPDLTVEILDGWEPAADMPARIDRWLNAGSKLIWLLDIDNRTVTIYVPHQRPSVCRDTDEIDGGEVFPDLRLAVKEIFGDAGISR